MQEKLFLLYTRYNNNYNNDIGNFLITVFIIYVLNDNLINK